jgi:hypothetical protein
MGSRRLLDLVPEIDSIFSADNLRRNERSGCYGNFQGFPMKLQKRLLPTSPLTPDPAPEDASLSWLARAWLTLIFLSSNAPTKAQRHCRWKVLQSILCAMLLVTLKQSPPIKAAR